MFKNYTRVLFQGDSITDARRNRFSVSSLAGYTKVCVDILKDEYKKDNFKFFNRGISGDRTKDLLRRYKKGFVRIKPNIVTVMIGINDVWRKYDRNDPTSPEQYRNNLIKLFADIKKDTRAKIIVLSPYLVPNEKHDEMRGDVDIFINECKCVAEKYADMFVNTDIPMNIASKEFGAKAVSEDGVHPALQGQKVLGRILADAIRSLQ